MMSTIDGGHYQALHHAVRAGKPDGYDQSNDLGGQSATRPPDGLILSPPFAPLAF